MTYVRLWTRAKQVPLWLKHSKHVIHQQARGFPGYESRVSYDFLRVHPRVAKAVSDGQAVVALESTIITHGMPHPHNLRTAQAVESIIEENVAIPATVAALEGKLHIGLERDTLERLATSQDSIKTSRRDLAWVLSQKLTGGTTVSGTMIAAHMAGIPIFVTGGIGGVHRGGETSFDISADLLELGRTPVTVVSAGVKSILDIPRTLEYLETQGVTVATFGPSQEFPAFFSRHSGVKSQIQIQTPREAAEMIDANLFLGLGSGILIGVPIPEEHAAAGEMIETAIQQAIIEASDQEIIGKDVTPFILARVNELTKGKSLEANISLIKNNAKVGSQIAVELAEIRRKKKSKRSTERRSEGGVPGEPPLRQYSTCSRWGSRSRRDYSSSAGGQPVVIGASIVDYIASVHGKDIVYGGATNSGTFRIGYGGVGRNVADAMSRLGAHPIFLSALGTDFGAQALRNHCSHMDLSHVSVRDDFNSGTYCVMLDQTGEVAIGIGDMDVNGTITPEYISQHEMELKRAPLVCMDGNIPAESIDYISKFCSENKVPLWFEPTCLVKVVKVCQTDAWKALTYVSPNFNELRSMYAALEGEETINFEDDRSLTDTLRECLQLSRVLLKHIYCLFITLGEDGVLVCRNAEPDEAFVIGSSELDKSDFDGMFSAVHYPAYTDPDHEGSIISVSGAGDCLAATTMVNMLSGHPADICIKSGLMAAQRSLLSHHAVPASIHPELLSPDFVSSSIPWEPNRLM